MKLTFILALLISTSVSAQKTFIYSGKTFSVMTFERIFTIDSSLSIEKNNPGWQIPDTGQIRAIHTQLPKIDGLKWLSSTKYEGDNYIQVDMYTPIKMFLAQSDNLNQHVYYTLVLIK